MCAFFFFFAKVYGSGEVGSVASYKRYFLLGLWQIILLSSCLRLLSIKICLVTSGLKYLNDTQYDPLSNTEFLVSFKVFVLGAHLWCCCFTELMKGLVSCLEVNKTTIRQEGGRTWNSSLEKSGVLCTEATSLWRLGAYNNVNMVLSKNQLCNLKRKTTAPEKKKNVEHRLASNKMKIWQL